MKTRASNPVATGRLTAETISSEETHPLHFKRVVVPVDFSEFSSKAIDYGLAISRQFDAELLLVTVIHTDFASYDIGPSPAMIIQWDTELKERVQQRLVELAQKKITGAVEYKCITRAGDPADEILDLVKSSDADLLVTATHGRTGLKHMFLGSVAEKLIRHAPCPVLVVHRRTENMGQGTSKRADLKWEKILVPLDFSAGSLRALDFAESMAQTTGGQLTLFHAVPPLYGITEYQALEGPRIEEDMLRIGEKQLAELARERKERGFKYATELTFGLPRNEIIARAEQGGFDVIVISTRGLGPVKHLLLGSTAEYVVRHASCPVLVIPTRKEASKKKQKSLLRAASAT